ncbi:MAG: GyrI-like domain-containing protein, partial [Desulfuromonadales bacterium]
FYRPVKVVDVHHFCLSIEEKVGLNSYGIVNKIIPGVRCALARNIGPARTTRLRPTYMKSGCLKAEKCWAISRSSFHYVNVGPNVREEEMITDVYLPLK